MVTLLMLIYSFVAAGFMYTFDMLMKEDGENHGIVDTIVFSVVSLFWPIVLIAYVLFGKKGSSHD